MAIFLDPKQIVSFEELQFRWFGKKVLSGYLWIKGY